MQNEPNKWAPITVPDEGQELCYECDGKRLCWSCEGAGIRDSGAVCAQCGGSGRCIVCAGSGQVPTGTASTLDSKEAKRRLKLIGHFREMGYADVSDAPSLKFVRRSPLLARKPQVVAYLRSAPSVSFSPGFVSDYFDSAQMIGTHTMRTDGEYVWPDFLAGYVEHYDVELPDEFLQHLGDRDWQLPAAIDVTTLSLPW